MSNTAFSGQGGALPAASPSETTAARLSLPRPKAGPAALPEASEALATAEMTRSAAVETDATTGAAKAARMPARADHGAPATIPVARPRQAVTPSRRSLLALLAASPMVGAAALPAIAAAQIPAAPDPVFAAIASHQASQARVGAMSSEQEGWDEAVDEDAYLWNELTTTQPTTLAGVNAFAAYIVSQPGLHWLCADDGPAQALESISEALAELAPSSPTAAPALAAAVLVSPRSHDPVFAVLAEWRALQKKLNETVGNVDDADAIRYSELTERVLQTVPTTIAGALALSELPLDEDHSCLEDAHPVLQSIATFLRSHCARIDGGADV
jgi:hypothetical protein